MQTQNHLETKRSLLANWYLETLKRHGRMLDSERCRHVVRAAGRSHYVTSEQLLNALDATYRELHLALECKDQWGCGADGHPSMLAVSGLAQRRLRARLIDEVRRGERMPQVVEFPDGIRLRASTHALEDEPLDKLSVLSELSHESVSTRKVVLLAAAGFSAPEVASRLGISAAAVRQRTSRFGRRLRAVQKAA